MLIRHCRDDGCGDHWANPGYFNEPPARFVIPGMIFQLSVEFSNVCVGRPDLGYQRS